jgi:hypothetical protein
VGLNATDPDLNCQSGKCNLNRCVPACRTSTDCPAGQACTYGLASITATQDIVPTCGAVPGAPGLDGASCTTNADCVSDFCDGTRCTDVCFSDADCTNSGWRCRPFIVKVQFGGSALGSYPLMSCGP